MTFPLSDYIFTPLTSCLQQLISESIWKHESHACVWGKWAGWRWGGWGQGSRTALLRWSLSATLLTLRKATTWWPQLTQTYFLHQKLGLSSFNVRWLAIQDYNCPSQLNYWYLVFKWQYGNYSYDFTSLVRHQPRLEIIKLMLPRRASMYRLCFTADMEKIRIIKKKCENKLQQK